jgi:hypothetical protein
MTPSDKLTRAREWLEGYGMEDQCPPSHALLAVCNEIEATHEEERLCYRIIDAIFGALGLDTNQDG